MLVRQYMSTDVVYANPLDGLHQTLLRMREHDIRHMPVLGDGGKLVGIISERDLRRPDFVDPDSNHARAFILDNHTSVSQAMSPAPTTIGPDDKVISALDLFITRHYGALPVMEGDKCVGVLSSIDLLRAFRDSGAA